MFWPLNTTVAVKSSSILDAAATLPSPPWQPAYEGLPSGRNCVAKRRRSLRYRCDLLILFVVVLVGYCSLLNWLFDSTAKSFFAAPTLDRFKEHALPSAHVDRLSIVPSSAVSNATGSVRRFEDDVVLLVRTGTTSLFEHLPMMLLAQQDTNEYRPNQVYY
ncbi:unnamed protein product [Jaminaea pallidilutea]